MTSKPKDKMTRLLAEDGVKHISNVEFGRQAITLTSVLTATCIGLFVPSTGHVNIIARIAIWILKSCLLAYTGATVRGYFLWRRGLKPLVRDAEAKYITVGSDSERTVEYYIFGSEKDDAVALVVLHGSGSTGKHFNQYMLREDALKKLNIRAISPSYPGHGGSDARNYRRITDWPITDLVPILKREKVDKFYVVGASYGTSHAMAVASALPERVLGLGLVAPYLPESICREANVWTDADMILRESQLENPAILLPILGVFFLADWFIGPGITNGYAEGKEMSRKHPDLCDVLIKDAHRSFMRGVNGQVFEMLDAETTQTWPDPRQIKVKNISVWYAKDDTIVPPEHGEWLEMNLKTEGRKLDIRKGHCGLGHFTWLVPPYCETVEIVKTLMEIEN